MSQSPFDERGRYLLSAFAQRPPFASFLPGIAGPRGIPLWVLTVNRGQAVASFGVADKDHPIVEFEPANKAYQATPATGFRTFLKLEDGVVYEPFAPWEKEDEHHMAIGLNELELQSRSRAHDLQTNVLYFTLPGEPVAALVRQVTVTNIGAEARSLELLDGLPRLIPYGVDNRGLKEIGRTLEAWMAVYGLGERLPYFHLPASAADSAEVETIRAGHFYLAFAGEGGGAAALLPPIVDPALIFGQETTLHRPEGFVRRPLAEILQERQITSGKTPCGFAGLRTTLAPGEQITLHSLIGHAGSQAQARALPDRLASAAGLAQKRAEANGLVDDLTGVITTRSGRPLFDAYCRQTFLDNVLRGGWPLLLGAAERPFVHHIYSRKHGDLERDYNDFYVAPEPYSQGNGNYRDVNQNRRGDVWFEPRVEQFNVLAFLSLIQADGYNPLVVNGSRFTLAAENRPAVLSLVDQPDVLAPLLEQPFTPGGLLRAIGDHAIGLKIEAEQFVTILLGDAVQHFGATFGEGFWVDHWLYNLDLIESYLAIFPDKQDNLLFEKTIPFYESDHIVRPRHQKTVLTGSGQVRQYGAVAADEKKAGRIAARPDRPNWLRTAQGEIAETTLFGKLLVLAINKFSTLDPGGMGVEMEAGKPGWYDALNGLPGLFGSSMPETYALERLLTFLRQAIVVKGRYTIRLPSEIYAFLQTVAAHLRNYHQSTHPNRDFYYWDAVSWAREGYRESIRLGLAGRTERINLEELDGILILLTEKVKSGIERAQEVAGRAVPPTYFAFEAAAYEKLINEDGVVKRDDRGRPFVRVTRFEPRPLPLFLEGAVYAIKGAVDPESARQIHRRVKQSDLYDRPLALYKVNASLDGEPHEIGRARAFTPGWLENESIWLHMAYKYLLALLQAGLYEEFWEEAARGLVPFFDPERYGRSPLENASFIVSSAHPDRTLHGAGFVARLTGATAEFLTMWQMMMAGPRPFFLENGRLALRLRPALPGWLFATDGTLSFPFLGSCRVTIHNPSRQDTWRLNGEVERRWRLHLADGEIVTLDGEIIPDPYARQVREGRVTAIELELGGF